MNDIDPAMWWILGPLIALQITLMLLALARLSRAEERVAGLPRAAWAGIIVFFQFIGPLTFLALSRGRREESAEDRLAAPADPARTIDLLYNPERGGCSQDRQ